MQPRLEAAVLDRLPTSVSPSRNFSILIASAAAVPALEPGNSSPSLARDHPSWRPLAPKRALFIYSRPPTALAPSAVRQRLPPDVDVARVNIATDCAGDGVALRSGMARLNLPMATHRGR